MPQGKNISGHLHAFALKEHINGETSTFKILEKRVLGHILPETIYLAVKWESTKTILFHKPHTAFLIISPTGATFNTFEAQINFEWWLCTLRPREDFKRVPCRDSNFLI